MKSFSGLSRREATLALLAASLPLGAAAQGNEYPNRPIKLIVPVPPGSGVDAVSRSLGAQMSEYDGRGDPARTTSRVRARWSAAKRSRSRRPTATRS